MVYYTHCTAKIPVVQPATCIVLKRKEIAPVIIEEITDGYFYINTDELAVGKYRYQQQTSEGEIVSEGRLELKQNLAYADEDFDPRSNAEITLEAIEAMLENRATAQQRKVQLGDKSIEYSTLEELLKWREYFKKQLRKEQNKTSVLEREIAILRRV